MKIGILGANGIVGASLPIALGSAVSHQTLGTTNVAVSFFGDGAMAEGVLHESFNMAALWRLPLLFVCENNGWSEFSPTSRQLAGTLEGFAAAFGIGYQKVDGNDVQEVNAAAHRAVAALRKGKGPAVLECLTKRVRGHYEGDPQKYRDVEDLQSLDAMDPVKRTAEMLIQMGMTTDQLTRMDEEIDADIKAAIDDARQDVEPSYEAALQGVYSMTAT